MSTESTFQVASERAEGWLGTVSEIARLGERCRVHPAYGLLEFLHSEYSEYADTLNEFTEKLRPLSDSQIRWPQDRGYSAVIERGTVSCWSSSHEAALGLVKMALDLLFYPAVSDSDPTGQWNRAEKLLADRWKALVIPAEEVASLRERIRRERAKMLTQDDEDGQPEESKQPEEVQPAVSDDYMAFTKLWKLTDRFDNAERFGTYRKAKSFLDRHKHTEIKRHSSGQRLEVHVKDWVNHMPKKDQSELTDEQLDIVSKEFGERLDKEREKKNQVR